MRIVEVIPQLGSGGAERFTVDLCNEMASRGHEVVLIVLHKIEGHGFYVDQIDERVKVISMNKRPGFDWRLFFRLHKQIKSLYPDVVHTHLRGIVYSAISAIRLKHPKFVHTVHNTADKEAGEWLSRNIRKRFLKKKISAVTISEESDHSFKEFYGVGYQSTLIMNGSPTMGVDYSRASEVKIDSNEDNIVLVNVARLQPQKNQIELVTAAELFDGKVKLLIVGENNTDIGRQIEAMGLKYSKMIGPRKNPRDYMAAADGFILSSIYEGMPITLIECFSVGAIPIVTPVGGMINMVKDGVNGIMAKGTTADDIAEAIRRFTELTDEQRCDMKHKSRESFAQYDISTCANRYLGLFIK